VPYVYNACRTVNERRRGMQDKLQFRRYRIVAFVFASFFFSWLLWFLGAGTRNLVVDLLVWKTKLSFSTKDLLGWLGNFAPGFVALFLIYKAGGVPSIKLFFRDCFTKRSGLGAFLPALVLPLIAYLPIILLYPINLLTVTLALRCIGEIALNIPLAPLWEEIGWRGYLFARVQTSLGTRRSCLITGILWALWHYPIRISSAPPGIPTYAFFAVFCLYVCALAFVLGWLFNRAGGSLLPVIFFHSFANTLANNFLVPASTRAGLTPLLLTTATTWAVGLFLVYLKKGTQ
jgi:uncharacterized protein